MGKDLTMNNDEYLDQIAVLRNHGMKDLESFKTQKELQEEKMKQMMAQTAKKNKNFSDELREM